MLQTTFFWSYFLSFLRFSSMLMLVLPLASSTTSRHAFLVSFSSSRVQALFTASKAVWDLSRSPGKNQIKLLKSFRYCFTLIFVRMHQYWHSSKLFLNFLQTLLWVNLWYFELNLFRASKTHKTKLHIFSSWPVTPRRGWGFCKCVQASWASQSEPPAWDSHPSSQPENIW